MAVGLCVLLLSQAAAPWGALAQEATWQPPEPNPTELDWIRMSSGEWLRGEIHLLRDKDLSFESEDLDELVIDWDDVVEIRSSRILTVGLEDATTFTGTVMMKGGVVKVFQADQVHEVTRDEILSIIEGRPTEWNFWSFKLSAGLVARAGNTEQADFNAIVLIRRETTKTRFDLGYNGNMGKLNGERNVNNHRGNARFDMFITKNLFATPASIEAFSDEFQNIDYRLTLAVGAGYFLVRSGDVDWWAQLGAGYQTTRYRSVQPGDEQDEDHFTLIPSTSVEYDLTGDVELTADYTAQIGVPEARNTVHHLFALLSLDLVSVIDLDLSLTWDRVESPKPDAEGRLPKRDDFRTSIGLGIDI